MALDRKIRIGISTSELLANQEYDGEDVEVRLQLGKTELARNFDLLMRARDRPNGILGEGEELSAPDTLVKSAESALKNGLPQIAERAVLSFLLQSPPKNQFYCRALFVQAQLQSQQTLNGQAAGDDLVVGTLKAVDFVRTALDVAMDPKNRPRYDFLVYNASVHYWNAVRPLLRPGVQRYLVESLSFVVACLHTVNDADSTWRCQLALALARCCDDAGQGATALAHASSALALLQQVHDDEVANGGNGGSGGNGGNGGNGGSGGGGGGVTPALWSDVRRCVVHMARNGAGDASKALDAVKNSGGNKEAAGGDRRRGEAEVALQCIKSNITTGDVGAALLSALETLVAPYEDGGTHVPYVADLLVEGGLLGASNGLDDIANQYVWGTGEKVVVVVASG